jgi:hypothetical protein
MGARLLGTISNKAEAWAIVDRESITTIKLVIHLGLIFTRSGRNVSAKSILILGYKKLREIIAVLYF